MYKVTTKVTYYAPDGLYCNVEKNCNCRFCVKTASGYSCSLYQEELAHTGKTVMKTKDCTYSKRNEIVEQPPEPASTPVQIDPKHIIDLAVNSFIKSYNSLRQQGFPEDIAITLAKEGMKN